MTDKEWLLRIRPSASDAMVEAFCERVAIILDGIDTGDYTIKLARTQALDTLL